MPKSFSTAEKIYQDMLLLTANDDFMRDVEKIRKKSKEAGAIAVKDQYGGDDYIFYDQTAEYDQAIKELRNKYNLSELYYPWLHLFCDRKEDVVKLHKMEYSLEPTVESLKCLKNYEGLCEFIDQGEDFTIKDIYREIEHCIAIRIYPETTLKDIIRQWDEIAKQRDMLYGVSVERKVRLENLVRDLYILELSKQGKTCSEIAKIINDDERFKKQTVSFFEVSRIIIRLKQRAKRVVPSKKT
jgi:hypothetical protein